MFRLPQLASIRGHHFHAGFIDADSIVIDLGAHVGEFSHKMSDRFGCRCYAIEPVPVLYSQIKATHLIKKFNYAITHSNGPTPLYISKNPEGNSIHQLPLNVTEGMITIEGVNFETFVKAQNIISIDLLKVDIEGAEVELFSSMSDDLICQINQITVEFHDFVKEFHLTTTMIKDIQKRLVSLGFLCSVFSWPEYKDVLFFNTQQCALSTPEYLYLRYMAKYLRGIVRSARRMRRRR